MQLIAPDILSDARSLSHGLLAAGLATGLLLWLLGWWGHRFWIVLIATAGAGIYGLQAGPDFGVQRLVAGLLLAVSAGVLALTLVRLFAYAAGGLAAWMIVHALAPLWNQPLLCFLIGGLVGLFLFRFWTMALTSFLGTLLLLYSSLSLADKMGNLDAVSWAEGQGMLLNWLCGLVAVAGFIIQLLLERRRIRKARESEEDDEDAYERSNRYYRTRHYTGHRKAG